MKYNYQILAIISFAFVLFSGDVHGQKNKRNKASVTDQLKMIASWYQAVSVSMTLQVSQFKQPESADTIRTDVELGYGPGRFYMKTGVIEQYIDDTMQVIVNHDAKMIHMYKMLRPDDSGMFNLFDKQGISDSMVKQLRNRYEMITLPDSDGYRTIKLLSKTKIGETDLRKEEISVICDKKDFRPVTYIIVKESLVPLDEDEYYLLSERETYKTRLLRLDQGKVTAYFLIRAETFTYRIQDIRKQMSDMIPQWNESVLKFQNGSFGTSIKYQDYLLSVTE